MKLRIKSLLVASALILGSAFGLKADTTTTRFGLTKPDIGSTNWGPKINTNYDTIDNAGGLSLSNAWTNTNSFAAVTTFSAQLQAATGGVASPPYSFTGRTTDGIASGAANEVDFVTNGSTRAYINNSGLTLFGAATLTISTGTSQIVLGNTRTVTIHAPTPASTSRTWTIPDIGSGGTFVSREAGETITGQKTFSARTIFSGSSIDCGTAGTATNLDVYPSGASSGVLRLSATTNSAGITTTVTNAAQTAAWTYTIPDVGSNSTFLMTAASQTVTGKPIIKADGILGTTAADSATAGRVGETAQTILARGSAHALSTTIATSIATMTITAGDWDIWGSVCYGPTGTTTITRTSSGVSLTANTLGGNEGTPNASGEYWRRDGHAAAAVGDDFCEALVPTFTNSSGSQTFYLVAESAFGTSTLNAYGFIQARRRR